MLPSSERHARGGRTRRVQKDMRRCGFLHPIIRLCPGPSPVITAAHATPITLNSFSSPHLRPRQIMRPAVDAPSPPLHLGVKYNPVRRVHPFLRHTARGTHPGLPAILASKKTNVRRGDKLPVVIKRIKVITVGVRYIQPR